LERRHHCLGENRHAILPTLAVANDDLRVIEVEVFHSKPQCLHEAQTASIQKLRDQMKLSFEVIEESLHIGARQNNGHSNRHPSAHDVFYPRKLNLENVAVQKQDRGERLVLGRCCDAAFDRQVRKELRDLRGRHVRRVSFAVEQNEAPNPLEIGSFCSEAVVLSSDTVAHTIEQLRGSFHAA
jgi:hypothetical protein